MSSRINVRRYTRGVLNFAQQTNALEQWRRDLAVLQTLCEDGSIRYFLEDPRLPVDARLDLVSKAVGDGISAAGLELLRVLVEDRAIRIVPQLARQYLREADRIEGIARVRVTTAEPLSDDLRTQLRRYLERDGRTVILEEAVDPAIVGGLILREEDRLLDLSVIASLKAMEEQLARI